MTFRIEPCNALTTLADCPPGWFCFNGGLFMKSEYRTQNSEGFWQSDAYCDSGEYFWGGAKSAMEREMLAVQPCSVVEEPHATDPR